MQTLLQREIPHDMWQDIKLLSSLSNRCQSTQLCGNDRVHNKAAVSWLLNNESEPQNVKSNLDQVCINSARASNIESHATWSGKLLTSIDAKVEQPSSVIPFPIGGIFCNTSNAQMAAIVKEDMNPIAALSRGNVQSPSSSGISQASTAASSNYSSGEEESVDSSGERKKHWSISLDESLAIKIYENRPRNAGSKYGSMAEAARIGELHGVSPKTIRDIWNRKSWVKATRPLWTPAEVQAFIPRKHRRGEEGPKARKRAKIEEHLE
eukprot:748838-Hanusia_phi.AAC.1